MPHVKSGCAKRGCTKYISPDGKKFKSLKEIEAYLGEKLFQGLDVTSLIDVTLGENSVKTASRYSLKKAYRNRSISRSRSRNSAELRFPWRGRGLGSLPARPDGIPAAIC